MKTIQEEVLKAIWRSRDSTDVKTIENETHLKKKQIYRAIDHLINRDLVKKEKETSNTPTKDIPPKKRIILSINNKKEFRVKKILRRVD